MKKKNASCINLAACAALVLLGLLVFRSVLFTSDILMTTDDNIGFVAGRQADMPGAFLHTWSEYPLLGFGNIRAPINWTNLLYWLLSPVALMNTIHWLNLVMGSVLLFLFLRRQEIRPSAALLGAMAAYWVGSNLTLTYAGHIPKFSIMMMVPAALLATTALTRERVLAPTLLFAACLGVMLTEQQDVALFCALPLAAYYIFRLVILRTPWQRLPLAWFLSAVVALLIASSSLIAGYTGAIRDVAVLDQSAEQQWDFATQWSWPPEETIAFVAPGYTGWRSGEPSGPYWGRMGRSPGWEQHGQGFMNFKLENTYLGFIPVLFALFAIYAAARRQTMLPLRNQATCIPRAEILFWAAAALLTLLLAFGKYFPLYRAFFALPLVSSIRNPNKFLQIFQICLAILAAWGLDALLAQIEQRAHEAMSSMLRPFFYALCLLCAFFGLWLLKLHAGDPAGSFIQAGWGGETASVIAANQARAIGHALLMLLLLAALFLAGLRGHLRTVTRRTACLAALIVIMAVDVLLLARHYITTMPASFIESNAVSQVLDEHMDHGRVALTSQEGFYNIWLTYLFPYLDLPAFNYTQMPRMPSDYQAYLSALQHHPIRMWQLAGVTHLLTPSHVYDQIRSQPALAAQLTPLLWFDANPVYGNNIAVTPREPGRGRHLALQFDPATTGRYRLIAGTRSFASDQEALDWLAGPDYRLFEQVAVVGDNAPRLEGRGIAGTVRTRAHTPATRVLEIDARQDAILRCADRYDPAWRARINGQTLPAIKVDYCMTGYHIPAGQHTLELAYRPSRLPFFAQLIGWLAALLAFATILTKHPAPAGQWATSRAPN